MDQEFSTADIRLQLARILQGDDFSASAPRRVFLQFIVEETLEGRGARLKGVTLAQTVFGRDETFEQQNDPVVRLEARRLRSDLDRYYAGSGRWDAIRISIPKGGYTPRFEPQETHQPLPLGAAPAAPSSGPSGIKNTLIMAVAALLVATAALAWSQLTPRDQTSALDAPKGPVIAVLPFLHLSEDPKRAYFAQGITQQLTTELVRFRDLWVLPLGTIAQLNSTSSDPQALAQELGAEFVLEGSVMETGETLSIAARLIDLNTGRYIWVRDYETDTTPTEIYATQDKIIQDVVGNLAGKYGILAKKAMETAERKAPNHLDAYDCVLRYYRYQIAIDLRRHPEIKACVEQATRTDPDYAEAWAVLSNLYMQEIRFELGTEPKTSLRNAKHAANRAVELDPESSAAHLMLANIYFALGDITGFKDAGRTALSLNPNSSTALAHYGMRLAFSGAWDEGILLVERAKTLNPVHPNWFSFPEVFSLYNRREYQQVLALLETIDMPDFFWVHLFQAASHGQLGNNKQAQLATEKLLVLKPNLVARASAIIQNWQLSKEFDRHLKQGLRKAGLDLPT
ncbi:hypothetical protein AB9F29_20260 [Falsihalocynthiibacter sp. S25ZX9]